MALPSQNRKRSRARSAASAVILTGLGASAIFVIATLFSGCATVNETVDPDKFYMRDIQLEVNGKKAVGALVTPASSSYRIKGEIEGNFDWLEIRSCHRQRLVEKEGDSFKYDYTPVRGIEDLPACPLEIRGLERDKGRDSFGFVDFESPAYRLPATLECNGSTTDSVGVSVCSAPAGLYQRVRFGGARVAASVRPTDSTTSQEDCSVFPVGGGLLPDGPLEFKMPRGQCQVIFKSTDGRLHRMTTLGYEDVVVRRF